MTITDMALMLLVLGVLAIALGVDAWVLFGWTRRWRR
jgi:hypothetical protein